MSALDTQALIDRVKLTDFLAQSQQTFNDQDIIDFANMELATEVTKAITDAREDFFVHFGEPFTVTQAEYELPLDSVGLRLKDVWRVDGTGFALPIPRLELHQVPYYYPTPWSMYPGQGAYYLKGNTLCLYPPNSFSGFKLQFIYFKRPNALVTPLDAAKVTGTIGPDVVTTTGLPSTWAVGDKLDVIAGDFPHDTKLSGVEILSISGSDFTIDPTYLSNVSKGDYFALVGEAPVVQYVPREAFPLLVQLTANRCLMAMGDDKALGFAVQKSNFMRKALTDLLMPRVENRPKKVVNTNSPATAGRWNTYWGW